MRIRLIASDMIAAPSLSGGKHIIDLVISCPVRDCFGSTLCEVIRAKFPTMLYYLVFDFHETGSCMRHTICNVQMAYSRIVEDNAFVTGRTQALTMQQEYLILFVPSHIKMISPWSSAMIPAYSDRLKSVRDQLD